MRPLVWITLVATVILSTSCIKTEEIPNLVDRFAFRVIGNAPIAKPDQLTLKEIHLDNGTLQGRDIVVKGAVLSMSKHSTHLVISDETARLLVVLTDLETVDVVRKKPGSKVVSVLGRIETGKKGLPFVKATALYVMKDPDPA